ncbi:MAG: hypothetical protein AAFU80_13230 [Pseudomonadota bacterium]
MPDRQTAPASPAMMQRLRQLLRGAYRRKPMTELSLRRLLDGAPDAKIPPRPAAASLPEAEWQRLLAAPLQVVFRRREDAGSYRPVEHFGLRAPSGQGAEPAPLVVLSVSVEDRDAGLLLTGSGCEAILSPGTDTDFDPLRAGAAALLEAIAKGRDPAEIGRRRVLALRNDRVYDGVFLAAYALWSMDRDRYDEIVIDADRMMLPFQEILSSEGSTLPMSCLASSDFAKMRARPDVAWVEGPGKIAPRKLARERIGDVMRALGDHVRGSVDAHRDRFTLFVSLDLEKRAWLEQEEGLTGLIEEATRRFGHVHLLVNGMTSNTSGRGCEAYGQIRAREAALMDRWQDRFGADLTVEHLFGQTMEEKARRILGASFYAGPMTSAILLPAFLDVPGVAYGTPGILAGDSVLFAPLPRTRIMRHEDAVSAGKRMRLGTELDPADALQTPGRNHSHQSYSIPPKRFLALCRAQLDRWTTATNSEEEPRAARG